MNFKIKMNIGFNGLKVLFGFAVMMQSFIEIRTADADYQSDYARWQYRITDSEFIINNTKPDRDGQAKVFVNRLRDKENRYDGSPYLLTQVTDDKIRGIKSRLQASFDHLVVIIHGFLDEANSSPAWHSTLGDAIRHHQPRTEVFAVDWREGAQTLKYKAAVLNAGETANMLAIFLRRILPLANERQISVHIIGHGLGAHIGRKVVWRLRSLHFPIYRLTCLDPFQFEYEYEDYYGNGNGNKEAQLTDVIHTDGYVNGFGDPRAFGTVDFYMNNLDRTINNQPGCKKTPGESVRHLLNRAGALPLNVDPKSRHRVLNRIFESLKVSLCSHGRAVEYFIEAVIDPRCKFTGRSLEEFGKQRVLGLDTFTTLDYSTIRGLKVYADTNSSYRFCPHAPPKPTVINMDKRINIIENVSVLSRFH
ncbi:lipoprotein lipase-like [Planococcus citri]|uniref:lipoprotein lipase-like n=1 Tax=Planococcus citri TaxID=170843 RepID=UPI0031F9FEA4